MYETCYQILVTHIYGTETLTAFQELVATEMATTMCLIAVALPFAAVLYGCRVVFGK